MARDYFPRVREARELLRERAQEIMESYLAICAEARQAGHQEVALNALQWLIEHMPAEEGVRVIDPSAAVQPKLEGPQGPQIAIGINLGTGPKALPEAQVIDVKPLKLT